MENIGRNIPNIKSAISSGLESVATGIQQNAQVQGPAPINDAFDSFLPEQIGIYGALEFLPRVGDDAQFPDPIQYFQMNSQFGGPQNSNSLPNEFIGVLKDQNFNPATELQGLVKNNEKYLKPAQHNTSGSSFGKTPGTALNEAFDFLMLKATDMQGTARQTETIAEASKFAGESLIRKAPEYLEGEPPSDSNFGPLSSSRLEDMINGGKIQGTADSLTQTEEKIEIAKPTYTPKEPEYLEGTPTTQKSETGSANQADQRGIIIVGGKEESAAQRGIIIVGGKTEGTYFETINDTVRKLNEGPAPETMQLFQQQLGALQDMSATVTQSVQMNQQIASSFAARIRI